MNEPIWKIEKYLPYLEDTDMTEAQKREWLEDMFSVVTQIINMEELYPNQQANKE